MTASTTEAALPWGITVILHSRASHHKLHRTWSSSQSFFPLKQKAPVVINCPQHEFAWLQILSPLRAQPTWEQAAREKWDQARPLWFSPGGVTAASRKALLRAHQKPWLHPGCTKTILPGSILNSQRNALLLSVMEATPFPVLLYSNKSLSDIRQSRNFYHWTAAKKPRCCTLSAWPWPLNWNTYRFRRS